MKPTIRDRAYAIVKKLKMAYTLEGCALQVELERELIGYRDQAVRHCETCIDESCDRKVD